MYEIKVLSDEEFDNLPFTETRGSDVSFSAGFANRHTGRAYVRNTQSHELNKFLVNHELDELMTKVSNHEDENGIRHFKGLPLLPMLGSFAGALGTAATIYNTARSIFSGGGGGGGGGQSASVLTPAASYSQAPQPTSQAPNMASPAAGYTEAGQTATTENPLSGDITSTIKASELNQEPEAERQKGFYSGRLSF